MNKYVYDSCGKVVQLFFGGDGAPDFNVISSVLSINPDLLYFDGDTLKEKSCQPSTHHIFDYSSKEWIDPRTPETEWPLIRSKRDQLLLACDWTQLPDVPLATKEAWAAYRQILRDITDQPDPFNIVWPVAP